MNRDFYYVKIDRAKNEGKILKEFKGRRKHIESIPNEILDMLFTGAE